MKKIFYMVTIMSSLLFISCSEEKTNLEEQACSDCTSYEEFLKNNPSQYATSTLKIDAANYQLDYVRSSEYHPERKYCYGRLETNGKTINPILKAFTNDYNTSDVIEIDLLGENIDLCNAQSIEKDNIKFLLVYYRDANNFVKLDYLDLANQLKETYDIGIKRASVDLYFLMRKSGINQYPSLISLVNLDLEDEEDNLLYNDNNDYVARIAGPILGPDDTLIDPGNDNGSGGNNPKCPLSCADGPQDECTNFFTGSCHYTFDDYCFATRNVIQLKENDEEELSSSLFSTFPSLYSFRDNFLTKTPLGQKRIIDYYTMSELISSGEVSISLLSYIKIANLIISEKTKISLLADYQNNLNTIVYTSSDAISYTNLLNDLKSESTNSKWNTTISKSITDVNNNANKTVSEIITYMEH